MTPDRPRTVVLKKNLARSIRQGHPWIYRDALDVRVVPDNGALVEIHTRDGRPIARGFWDERSPIAVRVLESGGPGYRFADVESLVAERLQAALDRRLERLDLSKTNAFRWLHGEGARPRVGRSGLAAATAVGGFAGAGAGAVYVPFEARVRLAAGARLPIRAVLDRSSRKPGAKKNERKVLENGVRFVVDLAHGQKGGLFIDQRENRVRVAERARGKSVLNLFGYTGGFAVHAAVAGARSTDTVDVAKPAIEAAWRNFQLNDLPMDRAKFHALDVFAFLTAAIERGDRWDIVISDPPSFAPKKAAVPKARRAYERLHKLASAVTAPGGLLCASSCSSHFGKDEFLASIEAGVRQAGRHWAFEALYGAAFDHPVLPAFPEGDYLKFAMGRVG